MSVASLLKSFTLDRASVAPAHSQIEAWLDDAIERGQLKPGDRLPGERELADSFGVSRMTLRQGLAGLEKRGLISRTQGRPARNCSSRECPHLGSQQGRSRLDQRGAWFPRGTLTQ